MGGLEGFWLSGTVDGELVGFLDGEKLGFIVGDLIGFIDVGLTVGLLLGLKLGSLDGFVLGLYWDPNDGTIDGTVLIGLKSSKNIWLPSLLP